MTRRLPFLLVLATALPLAAQAPPVARRIPKVDTLHGEVRVDDYSWLREKTNPEVITRSQE